jgi:multidrug efflux pump subunit AcrA (membrane-fusion protein)
MTAAKVVATAVVLAVLAGVVFTQEGPADKKEKPIVGVEATKAKKMAGGALAAKKPAVHKVEKKPFKVELTVKGILEPRETAEIAYRPQPTGSPLLGQGPLTIRKIATHGSKVKKGDVLVAFDTRKIDQAIRDQEAELKVLEANIKVAQEELPLLERSLPVDLAAAERAKKRADEDMNYFLEVARPQDEKQAEFSLKSARFFLEYAQEELRQLEKMYKSHDLTEDTEQIILRRQRHQVESATFALKAAELRHNLLLKVTLPRREKDMREGVVKQGLLLDKARNTLAPQAAQKREALAKMRNDHEKHVTQLESTRHDRDAMTVRSPIDGIVYHGKFHKGQWSLTEMQEGKLVVDGSVMPGDVFLTVVEGSPLAVRLTVEEKDAHLLKPGQAGKAHVAFDPDRKLKARVTGLSPVPAAPGKYEVLVALELAGGGAELMPGMGCSIKFVPHASKAAITVPSGCVVEDEDRHFVTVVRQGKRERREVTPGRSGGGETEILSGLREGEEVLLDPAAPAPKGGDQ